MNSIKLSFEQPLLLLLLIPALALVLIPWLRIPAERRSGVRRVLPAIVHCVVCAILVCVIAGFTVTIPAQPQEETEEPAEEAKTDTKVLFIASDTADAQALGSLLPDGVSADVIVPAQAPESITALNRYSKVCLFNVSADKLPSSFGSLLSQYVTDGGALLLSGGDSTFSKGAMNGTAYETLSPVSFDYTQTDGESVALMLVLDCSNSMSGMGGGNRFGGGSSNSASLSMAKQGAINSIEALTENDYVGIVSFNSKATLQAQLLPATDTQKAVLSRTISALTTSQGTYYTEALKLAWEQLKNSTADVKHVIFLSDGEPSDSGYDSVVKQMAANGITVSTIALGYSSTILNNMAAEGGGRYYAVTGVSDLPDIMLSETEQVAADPLIEKTTTVALAGGVTAGLPDIGGYIGTTLKSGAELKLQTESGDPVYAAWDVSAGQVYSFTSDLTGSWTAEWRNSDTGTELLKQILASGISTDSGDAADAVQAQADEGDRVYNLLLPFALIALILMLTDIAVRRLRWKDILLLWAELTGK